MEIKKLREKEKTELVELLEAARKELVKFKADRKIGTLTDGSVVAKKRREIAQILTVIGEKDILEEGQIKNQISKIKSTN